MIRLFYKNQEKYIASFHIKIGYFENEADLIFQNEIHGNRHFAKLLRCLLEKIFGCYQGFSDI